MTEPTNRALQSLKSLQSPTLADRQRVRDSLQRTLAAGATPDSARRVMDAMQHAGTRGASAWLAYKWVVSVALIGAGAIGTAVWRTEPQPVLDSTSAVSAVPGAQTAVAAPAVSQRVGQQQAKASGMPAEAGPDTEAVKGNATESAPAIQATRPAQPRTALLRARNVNRTALAQAPAAAIASPVITAAANTAAELPQSPKPAEAAKAAVAANSQAAAAANVPPATVPGLHLAEELALLRRADAALRDKRATAALSALSAHASRFPDSALRTERIGLQAIALCMQGDPYAARARDAFLNEHESSPLASRVRNACLIQRSETESP